MLKAVKLLKSENVRIRFSKEFDIVDHWNERIKSSIDNIWNQKVEINPKLFNGTKFRIHGSDYDKAKNELTLNLGLTDYKSFIGTYYNNEIKDELISLGKKEFNDPYILFARVLGVSVTILTADNKFVFLKRSDKLIEEPGVYDNIGGHPEPSEIQLNSYDDKIDENIIKDELFDSILREMEEEINVKRNVIKYIYLHGISESNRLFNRPSLIFVTKLNITSKEVKECYNNGPIDKFESSNVVLMDIDEFKEKSKDESKFSYISVFTTNRVISLLDKLE